MNIVKDFILNGTNFLASNGWLADFLGLMYYVGSQKVGVAVQILRIRPRFLAVWRWNQHKRIYVDPEENESGVSICITATASSTK